MFCVFLCFVVVVIFVFVVVNDDGGDEYRIIPPLMTMKFRLRGQCYAPSLVRSLKDISFQLRMNAHFFFFFFEFLLLGGVMRGAG